MNDHTEPTDPDDPHDNPDGTENRAENGVGHGPAGPLGELGAFAAAVTLLDDIADRETTNPDKTEAEINELFGRWRPAQLAQAFSRILLFLTSSLQRNGATGLLPRLVEPVWVGLHGQDYAGLGRNTPLMVGALAAAVGGHDPYEWRLSLAGNPPDDDGDEAASPIDHDEALAWFMTCHGVVVRIETLYPELGHGAVREALSNALTQGSTPHASFDDALREVLDDTGS